MIKQVLPGHNGRENAYVIEDYPYGRFRTKKMVWIESKPGKGDRCGYYTINPKNGQPTADKYDIYYPFLFLFMDEKGHVHHSRLDAYDLDAFPARFKELIAKLGVENITPVQQLNIRDNYKNHLQGNAPFVSVKYTNPNVYKDWLDDVVFHIYNAPFETMTDHPAPPAQDAPENEVKIVFGAVKPKPITEQDVVDAEAVVEAIKAIIAKELPYGYSNVHTYKMMGTQYIAIWIGANGKDGKPYDRVSLCLDPKDWGLKPQVYGGQGGQTVYRKIDPNNPKEKYLAMKGERVTFRPPKPTQKDVLRAIELFCINYKKLIAEQFENLLCHEFVDYDYLLNGPAK